MASSEPNIPSSRFPSALQWFSASHQTENGDPGDTDPNGVQRCYITVPFEHFLRAAQFNCTDIDNVGTLGAELRVAAVAGDKLGTLVGTALTDGDLASTGDVIKAFNIVLAAADIGAVRAAGTTYHMMLVGTAATDFIDQPMLTIGVEPTNRTRL